MDVYLYIDKDELLAEIGALLESSNNDAFVEARIYDDDDTLVIEYPRGGKFILRIEEA